MQLVRAALAEVADRPIEEAVRKLVAVAIDAHRIDPKLHRVLAEQIPRTGRLKKVETFNRETYALFRTYLEAHRGELRAVDLGFAAFVCVASIEALAHAAVLHRPEMRSDEAVGTLIDEATRLVLGYLQPAVIDKQTEHLVGRRTRPGPPSLRRVNDQHVASGTFPDLSVIWRSGLAASAGSAPSCLSRRSGHP